MRVARSVFLAFAIILLAVSAVSSPAQQTRPRAPVSEAQVVKVVPVLRTLSAQVRRSQAPEAPRVRRDAALAARIALLENIKLGKIDPLEWIEAQTEHAVTPSLAEYSAAASRFVTGLSLQPSAVFEFGLEASEIGEAKLNGDREAQRRLVERGADQSDAQQKVNAAVDGIRRFYRDHRFPGFEPDSPLAWSTFSPDSLLTVTVMEANPYRAWGNTSLPTGPILEISWNEDPGDEVNTGEPLSVLLGRIGMNDREFLDLLTALVTARRDTRDPSKLVLDPKKRPESEADRKIFDEVADLIKVRSENAALYQRYARTLDPLLDAFDGAER